MALAPGDARTLDFYGPSAVLNGRTEAGIAAARRAVVLDPLDPKSHLTLTRALYSGRHYDEALAAASAGLSLDPASALGHALRGLIYYALGRYKDASASCEGQPGYANKVCLAVTYEKLGRHADAESQRAKLQTASGHAFACVLPRENTPINQCVVG
jgi:tetratricopeptide (TPR) repeat protein